MINLDFANIRIHDGSQDKGFEELVCQLAHLIPPDNARYFVRKEGNGGDAGAECYWKLNDDTEYAWQAKYFLGVITDKQWDQISDSVKTVLEKHPKLTKYYICLPRDWTDSRKEIKGKSVKSSWDKWIDHVAQWEQLSSEKGMKVQFKYWCKHEISQMLQRDKPEFLGRALYWFNEPVINTEILIKIAEKSRKSLGERFTPEFHMDLPIANKFDCLGLTKNWNKQLEEQFSYISEVKNECERISDSRITLLKDKSNFTKLNDVAEKLYCEFSHVLMSKEFFGNISKLKEFCQITDIELEKCSSYIYELIDRESDSEIKKKLRELSHDLDKITFKIRDMSNFLYDKAVSAGKNKSMLLIGEAGIGKSHLLCDISLKRLGEGFPTLFLLGQHYSGGNPLEFICSELGLPGYSHRTVLGALDSLGESKSSRFLIVIDAINEGVNRDAWYDNLMRFLCELEEFNNIAVALSCRNTYEEYLIPQELDDNKLIRIEHYGFKGYENRAALMYLAKQGISKPGTPIMTPEFTNPLFLKTCCKAIKTSGENKFPKGLNGFNRLFEFYFESIEQVIGRKKKYRNGEHIVAKAVNRFVDELYPKYIYGIPIDEARTVITEIDPKMNIGEPLFDLLIDEGIISLDVIKNDSEMIRGIEVVRFTYERFSDYVISLHIIENCNTEEQLVNLFATGGEIEKIINENNRYRYSGIIEALGIVIPEKFNKEFIEFMDFHEEEIYEYNWFINKTFYNTILWRTGKSVTLKSLKLLNEVSSYSNNKLLDILLSLSTEPEHPWNADFLDYNLEKMNMPERDAFWSIYIAINDKSENEDGEETIVRTLIEWALNVEAKDVEPERLRLISIVLLWMTTTSNRKVRDQATKSLSRILLHIPEKIVSFIEKYNNCDDIYLVERLYASIYGTIMYLDNDLIIKEIGTCVYNYQFKNNKPYPDILLRDYARGIVEFAYFKNLLNDLISNIDIIRPPYLSESPIENPSIKEIDSITGDEFSSSIKRSLMGFIGDFGRYTMNCVHDWSPTSILEKKPQTADELKRIFAKKLPKELRDRYEEYLNIQEKNNKLIKEVDIEDWLNELDKQSLEEEEIKDYENAVEDTWERLKTDIIDAIDEIEKEEFRWISGFDTGNRVATFSKKMAQRWVCKKAYKLGWTEELFADFERIHSNGGSYSRQSVNIERIGKKYQWIAFHELLARMSDNLMWIDKGYSEYDNSKFSGPWQINKRDIDPTIWLRKTGDSGWEKWEKKFWWQPYIFPFVESKLDYQIKWLWDRTLIPHFKSLLNVLSPIDNKQWVVLCGKANWTKVPTNDKHIIPEQDVWYNIHSCIIHKNDFDILKSNVRGNNLCGPYTVLSTGNRGYFGEYPWHPYYSHYDEWEIEEDELLGNLNVEYHVPVCEYEWGSGSLDHSISESISFYMPSPKLIKDLHLMNSYKNPGEWRNEKGQLVFIDPSVINEGPSYGLIRKDIMNQWLDDNGLLIVWLIGGEKQLFTNRADKFYGRVVYSGVFTSINNEIEGELWFEEEKGRNI